MIKINKSDGGTLSFELNGLDRLDELKRNLEDRGFVEAITGISSLHNTFWHAIPKPKRFRKVRYFVEHVKRNKRGVPVEVGEKIICQADDVQLSVLVYYSIRPKMTRIELRKIGKQRFTPSKEVGNGINIKEDK